MTGSTLRPSSADAAAGQINGEFHASIRKNADGLRLRGVDGVLGAVAQTPKDTVVMAKQIDDIISLDPAEAFEFSGVEVGANVYDKLIGVDLDQGQRSGRRTRRELDGQPRQPDLHLQAAPRRQVPLRQRADRGRCGLLLPARGDAEQVAGLHPRPVRPQQGQRAGEGQGDRRQHRRRHRLQALRPDLLPQLPDLRRRLDRRLQAGQGQ